jgi:uncharacterized protein (TIGR03067 family)
MRTLATIACLILSLGVLPADEGRNQEKPQKTGDEKELRGRWRVVVFESEGYWLSAYGSVGEYYRSLKVTLTGERITIKGDKETKPAPAGIEFIWNHGYNMDRKKRPAEIDIRLLRFSPDGEAEDTGRVWRGIYDLQGNQLVMCIDTKEPSKRPREFSNPEGSKHVIMLLKREKEEKGKPK